MEIDSSGRVMQVQRAAAQVADATMLGLLWLILSLQALARWTVGYYPTLRQRQRAQSTIEIVIGMAVLAVLALAVWKIIGPAVTAKASGIATELNTSGTGATGTGG
jgi:hypothetical protein